MDLEEKANYILVIGSSNTDMVIRSPHLPGPGETILGTDFFMNPGGKGANQAVAAARLGGQVVFICKTGEDIFGREALAHFKKEGIETSHILTDPNQPSGVALITVDDNAENCIVVASGANGALMPEDLETHNELIANARLVLLQLEIPLSTVSFVAGKAVEFNVPVILNPAPAAELPPDVLKNVFLLTPNETEAEMISGIKVTGIDTARLAAAAIRRMGVRSVIITLGSNGALIHENDEFVHVPGKPVKAVDTTAAGDIFNGAVAVAVARGYSLRDAAEYACSAAAISVTRLGAQASAPYQHEIGLP